MLLLLQLKKKQHPNENNIDQRKNEIGKNFIFDFGKIAITQTDEGA